MSYISVTTVVEGAVDDERDLPDDDALTRYCDEQRRAAEADGLRTEVFIVRHSHDIELDEWGQTECACAQYAQDHRPVLAVNA